MRSREHAVAVADPVAAPGEDPTERALVRTEPGAPPVVLEPGEDRQAKARVGLDDDLADQPVRARGRHQVDEAEALEVLAVAGLVGVAEELEAGAHGEDHRARRVRALDRGT